MVPSDDSTPPPSAHVSPGEKYLWDHDSVWDEVEQTLALTAPELDAKALPPADGDTWAEVEQDLGEIIDTFQGLQDDLNYRRAREALEDLVSRLDLSPRERVGLDSALHNLTGLMDKLEHTVVHIAVFGLVGRGKSSLLNALVGQDIFETGPTHGVTQTVEGVTWSVSQEQIGEEAPEVLRVSLQSLGKSKIELIDTPGLDEVGGRNSRRPG
jgi:GTP-binding protein Era